MPSSELAGVARSGDPDPLPPLPNRTTWPAFSVPLSMVTAQEQSGGKAVATGTFSTSGASQLISVAASGSSTSAAKSMGVSVQVDDRVVGSINSWANPPNFDLPLTPRRFEQFLPPGSHTITLTANGDTATGFDDRVAVSVIDLGDNPDLLRPRLLYYGPYDPPKFVTCGGTVMLWVAASGWSNSAPGETGVSVWLDGERVASSTIWANRNGWHLTFVPVQVVLPNLAPGLHQLIVSSMPGTTTDGNDVCAVEVLELTAPPQVLTPSVPIQNKSCSTQGGGGTVASAAFSTTSARNTVLLRAMASAWTPATSSPLNLTVSVDGTERGVMTGFASSAYFHVPLAPAEILLTGLSPGTQHEVELTADSNTSTDGNDRCTVSLLELAAPMPK